MMLVLVAARLCPPSLIQHLRLNSSPPLPLLLCRRRRRRLLIFQPAGLYRHGVRLRPGNFFCQGVKHHSPKAFSSRQLGVSLQDSLKSPPLCRESAAAVEPDSVCGVSMVPGGGGVSKGGGGEGEGGNEGGAALAIEDEIRQRSWCGRL